MTYQKLTDHKHYKRWAGIKARCYNPNVRGYKWYGARGIGMCEEWRTSSAAFLEYIDELGEIPDGYSIDRIDNDRGYEPGNIKYSTQAEQCRNRTSNIIVDGKCLTDVAEDAGISFSRAKLRHDKNLPIDAKLKAGRPVKYQQPTLDRRKRRAYNRAYMRAITAGCSRAEMLRRARIASTKTK